jgi:hypothetical protein
MTTTAATAIQQQKTADLFELCSLSGKTKVAYSLSTAVPLSLGHTSGPSLKYDGPEGSWTFDASQITHENTSLGQLISVALKPANSTFTTAFWLFLPPVLLVANDRQSFTTFCVKAQNGMNHEVERFFGDAKSQAITKRALDTTLTKP